MISLLNPSFLKEAPPRDHSLLEVGPTHRRSLVLIRLWDPGRMTFPMARIPQCHAYLLSMAYSLDSILVLPLRPHGKDYHRAHLHNTPFTHIFRS